MNEQELGKEIAKLLDYSASDSIKQSTAYRLQSARRAALEHYQPALKIVNSGNGTSIFSGHDWHFNTGKLILLVMVFFAFVVGSTSYWKFLEKSRHDVGNDSILIDSFSTEDQNDTELDWKSEFPADELQLNNTQDLSDESNLAPTTNHHSEMMHDPSLEVETDIKREVIDELPADSQFDQTNTPVSNSSETHADETPEKWLMESN